MLATQAPYAFYADRDGTPLNDGRLYFGVVSANPETSPITVYWDAAGTQPALQPIRTRNGFPLREGTPAVVYAPSDYSLTVKDAANQLISYSAAASSFSNALDLLAQLAAVAGAGLIGYSYSQTYLAGSVGAWMKRIVFVADHGTNFVAIQAAMDRCYALGGGLVIGDPAVNYGGSITTAAPALQMREGVQVNMCWADMTPSFGAGNVFGVRGANYSSFVDFNMAPTTGGAPSSQFIWHAPFSIGEPNGSGGTPASPAAYVTVHHCTIRGVITPCRQYGPMVQMMGDARNNLIDVRSPDNAVGSGVHLDWGDVGSPVDSSNIAGTRAAFDLGNCYTTHPHDNTIIVDVGVLSVAVSLDLGASGCRISAGYNNRVRITCASVTLSAFRHIGGDLGFEFAPAAIKPLACKGNVLESLVITAPTASFGDAVYVDTLADNVYREQQVSGYVPLMNPLMHGDVQITANASGANMAATYGARVIQARGVHFVGGSFEKFENGILFDEFTQDCSAIGVLTKANRLSGVKVGGPNLREDTERILVLDCTSYGNGTAGVGYGVEVARGIDCRVKDCFTGAADEATQDGGIIFSDNELSYGNLSENNRDLGATSFGHSYPGTLAPNFFDQVTVVAATADLSDPQTPIIVSQSYLAVENMMNASRWAKRYKAIGTSGNPTTGHWKRGSIIEIFDIAAGAIPAKSVTTSGSFGTLLGISNAVTNVVPATAKQVTMSLAATTLSANVAANAYSIQVTSAANLRIGLLCTVAGCVTDAKIIAIAGTTLQLNKPCKAALSGAAFTTAGVIEGEVVTINTAAPLVGVVMKVAGTTVTLDTAAATAEVGRAVAYNAPVFKDHAAIAA